MAEQAERFVVGAGVTIVGDIDAGGSLRIEGSVRGRVFVRGTLEVAAGAVVEGFIQALEIDVWGRLAGVVRAATEVRLHADAQISGDVEAPRVRFVKAEAPGAPPLPRVAAPRPPVRPPPPPPPPPPVPLPVDDEPIALPPAAAGQTPGVLPPWPPQGVPFTPPVWAPRSARPATVPPTPPAPPMPPAPPEPPPAVEVAGDASGDGPPPPPPSITGGRRQIVVKRK
ncbi:MAG: polymer-forming cytoskeletal protein [Deltaproteobacteria bacterium]|nr:polymer-forming cytoskeletal protein [Deltaproteobacteria bacterium]